MRKMYSNVVAIKYFIHRIIFSSIDFPGNKGAVTSKDEENRLFSDGDVTCRACNFCSVSAFESSQRTNRTPSSSLLQLCSIFQGCCSISTAAIATGSRKSIGNRSVVNREVPAYGRSTAIPIVPVSASSLVSRPSLSSYIRICVLIFYFYATASVRVTRSYLPRTLLYVHTSLRSAYMQPLRMYAIHPRSVK